MLVRTTTNNGEGEGAQNVLEVRLKIEKNREKTQEKKKKENKCYVHCGNSKSRIKKGMWEPEVERKVIKRKNLRNRP